MKFARIVAGYFASAFFAQAQIVLRPGDVQTFGYLLTPSTNPCVTTDQKLPNIAGFTATLDADSMQSGNAFLIEILNQADSVMASSMWYSSNSAPSLSTSGDFYPSAVRLTGVTGSVTITSVSMPWSLSQINPVLKRWQSCAYEGVPFVPNLHLVVQPHNLSQIKLRWTTNVLDCRLEVTDVLSPPVWQEVTNSRSVAGGYYELVLDRSSSQRYFRLHKP